MSSAVIRNNDSRAVQHGLVSVSPEWRALKRRKPTQYVPSPHPESARATALRAEAHGGGVGLGMHNAHSAR